MENVDRNITGSTVTEKGHEHGGGGLFCVTLKQQQTLLESPDSESSARIALVSDSSMI